LDPNEIAAQALKARLMGDMEGFQRLQGQLEEAKARERGEGGGGRGAGRPQVVLHEYGTLFFLYYNFLRNFFGNRTPNCCLIFF
jgi:hypothetical protein